MKEVEVLNTTYLQKAKKVSILLQQDKQKRQADNKIPKNNALQYRFYMLNDNQGTHFTTSTLILKKERLWTIFSQAYLNKELETSYGGLRLWYNNIKGLLLYDQKEKSIGFDFEYQYDNFTLSLQRKNLIYSKQTKCSAKEMNNRIALSHYLQLSPFRGLWYSLAYEKMKKNSAFTPQFDWEYYARKYKNILFVLDMNGWYQFNTTPNKCYYSPQKTDSTLLALRSYVQLPKQSQIRIEIAKGYSFWEKKLFIQLSFGISLQKYECTMQLE